MPEISIDSIFDKYKQDPEYRAHYRLCELADVNCQKIRQIREARGMSQAQLAKLLRTQQSRVSQLEDPNYARHTLLSLAKVAEVLGLKLKVELVDV